MSSTGPRYKMLLTSQFEFAGLKLGDTPIYFYPPQMTVKEVVEYIIRQDAKADAEQARLAGIPPHLRKPQVLLTDMGPAAAKQSKPVQRPRKRRRAGSGVRRGSR